MTVFRMVFALSGRFRHGFRAGSANWGRFGGRYSGWFRGLEERSLAHREHVLAPRPPVRPALATFLRRDEAATACGCPAGGICAKSHHLPPSATIWRRNPIRGLPSALAWLKGISIYGGRRCGRVVSDNAEYRALSMVGASRLWLAPTPLVSRRGIGTPSPCPATEGSGKRGRPTSATGPSCSPPLPTGSPLCA